MSYCPGMGSWVLEFLTSRVRGGVLSSGVLNFWSSWGVPSSGVLSFWSSWGGPEFYISDILEFSGDLGGGVPMVQISSGVSPWKNFGNFFETFSEFFFFLLSFWKLFFGLLGCFFGGGFWAFFDCYTWVVRLFRSRRMTVLYIKISLLGIFISNHLQWILPVKFYLPVKY